MSELDRIVDIVITRNTKSIASANFSTPLFLSKTATEPIAIYKSAKEVSDAGYAVDSHEYLSAQAHFLVENHPPEFKIGFWDVSASISTALDTILDLDNQFYGLLYADPTEVDKSTATGDSTGTEFEVGAPSLYSTMFVWAEANGKFLFGGEPEATTLETITAMNALSLQNGMCFVSTFLRSDGAGIQGWNAVQGYGEVAFCSTILGKPVGSYTAENQKLKGQRANDFSTSEVNAIELLNGTYYYSLYDEDITGGGGRCTDGSAGTGERIDVEIGIDWVEIRMQEAVFKAIIVADKIPYTDKGTNTIMKEVTRILNLAVTNTIFASFTTTKEPVSEQTPEDKANRVYNGISWSAVLSGAVHSVTIYGNVEV